MGNIEKIGWQVIDVLVAKVASLIGENAVRILPSVRDLDRSKDPSPEIVYQLAEELAELLGKNGAFAIIRQLGREIGQEVTEGKTKGEAVEILRDTLRQLGFAYAVELAENNAYICNCVFYEILKKNGHGPIEQPVCWAGWGFIEGSLKRILGSHHITWKERDYEHEKCRFHVAKDAFDE